MSIVAQSHYTAPDSTAVSAYTPDVGSPWIALNGDWTIIGNKAFAPSGVVYAMEVVDTGLTDYTLTMVGSVSSSSFQIGGVWVRVTGVGEGWLCGAETLGAGAYIGIREYTGGVSTLQAFTVDLGIASTTTTFTVVVSGTSVTLTVTDGSTVTYTTMGSNLTGTYAGMAAYTASGVFGLNDYDNFEVNGSSVPPLVLASSVRTRSVTAGVMTAAGKMSCILPTRSRVSASMDSIGVMATVCRTRSKVSGSMLGSGALIGYANGYSVLGCLLKGDGVFLSSLHGRSKVSGTLLSNGVMVGLVGSRSTAYGDMLGTGVMAALSRGVSKVTAFYSGDIVLLSASMRSMSTVRGILSAYGVLTGFILSRSKASGLLDGTAVLSANTRSRSLVKGSMVGTAVLGGVARGTSVFRVLDIVVIDPVFDDLDNYLVSGSFISSLRSTVSANMPDDCLIYDLVPAVDSLRTPVATYVARAKIVKGRLQYIPRVPRTPTVGESNIGIGDYIIKLPWDTDMLQTARIRVNGGKFYQVQVVDRDKYDRATVSVYCNQLTDKSMV